jgi:hypothetical protein
MWVDGKKGSILYYNIYTYIHVIKADLIVIYIYVYNIDMYIYIVKI